MMDFDVASFEQLRARIFALGPEAKLFLRPTSIEVDLSQISDRDAERLTMEAINGLFAAHRTVTEHERNAYIRDIRDGDTDGPLYIFESFVNGDRKHEPGAARIIDDLGEAVANSFATVAARFPDRAKQQVVWRIEPEVTRHKAQHASRKFGMPFIPPHFTLYMRLIATPLGV